MIFMDMKGTSSSSFQIQKGGPKFVNAAGEISLYLADGATYTSFVASVLKATEDAGLILNADAAGAAADWAYTITRPAAGMSEDVEMILPVDFGSAGLVLTTDGAGNLSWASPSIPSALQVDVTDIAWDSAATIAMFTLPAGAIIDECKVIIDLPYDGTPALEVGIVGTTNKYMADIDNDLVNSAAGDSWSASKNLAAPVAPEAIIATYDDSGTGEGNARIVTKYVIPS